MMAITTSNSISVNAAEGRRTDSGADEGIMATGGFIRGF